MISDQLQNKTGTYIVWLHLERDTWIRTGSLGLIAFKAGFYAYAGSAFGPGGIRARLGRHFKSSKTRRWHIDYLRAACSVQEAWVSYDEQRLEHRWAQVLMGMRGARLPAARFGASDCECAAHLVRFSRIPSLRRFVEGGQQAGVAVERIKPDL